MKIIFNEPLWLEQNSQKMVDMTSPFAPVDNIRLWLRTQSGLSRGGENESRILFSAHEFYCFYICLEGEGQIEIDGVPHFIGTDEVLGVLPRHPHRRLEGPGNVKYLLLRFLCREGAFIQHLFNGTFQLDSRFEEYIQKLVSAYEQAVSSGTEQNNNEAGLALAMLLNRMTECEQNPLLQTSPSKRIHDALKMIIDPENLNVPFHEIARNLGITPGHLSDLVHDNLGYPPRKLKHSLRYQLAVNHLLHSSLNITQIAEAAGFKSVYAFSRFFKNESGTSPLVFRKLNKKKPSGG